jgi:hypothetical protein
MKIANAKIFLLSAITIFPLTSLADMPATHGMVLFGGETTYASHLPMFHAPHAYQAVFELKVSDMPRGTGAWEQYKELSSANKDVLFTLVPEKMDLAAVIAGTKTRFSANIFQGHFEKDGVDLGPVLVTVSKVVFSQKLNVNSLPNSDYVVFGSKGEYFSVKKIGGIGSYDTVLKVGTPKQVYTGSCPTRLCGITKALSLGDENLPVTLAGPALELPNVEDSLIKLGGKNDPNPIWDVVSTEAKIESVIYGSKEDLSH